MALHCTLQKLERGPAIPPLRRENLQQLALVINGTPKVVRLTIDLHENLIRVPSPLGVTSMLPNARLPDHRGEPWAKPIPPEPHRLVADIDAALEQEILDLSQ